MGEDLNSSTAISHLCVVGCSMYYLLYQEVITDYWMGESYKVMTINSLIGLWKWGIDAERETAIAAYRHTSFIQMVMTLPCIGMTMWISNSHGEELGWAHVGICLLPLAAFYGHYSRAKELTHFVVGVNALSIAFVSHAAQNYWGIASAIVYSITHFVIGTEGYVKDVPIINIYNYSLCLFAFLAFHACINHVISDI